MKNIENYGAPSKRPVPTSFEKSNSFDDLIFYKEITPPEKLLKNLGQGKVVISEEDFLNCGLLGEEYGITEIDFTSSEIEKALSFELLTNNLTVLIITFYLQ